MTQLRLTNDYRKAIARAALTAAFEAREKAFEEAEDALAREAYAAAYPANVRTLAMTIPANWLRRDNCLRFTAHGMAFTLRTMRDHLPVPYRVGGSSGYGCHSSHAALDGDLADRVRDHAVAKEHLRGEHESAERKLMAMLSSVQTFGKLKDIWPEGVAFYQRWLDAPAPAGLPTIRVDEINAALGLVSA